MLSTTIGLLGAGRMATALASGFVRAKLVTPDRLVASDPNGEARDAFTRAVPGAEVVADNGPVVAKADLVWLAVKPQTMDALLGEIRGAIRQSTLVVSIAAGVTIGRLSAALPAGQRIVRVMPNTPCLIGRGASAYSLGPHTTRDDAHTVGQLLSAVGEAYEVPESQLDAVTGLSGSGPAFVYTMIESLAAGGVAAGLPADLAAELAVRTAAGAAEMVIATGDSPAVLRERVTSPGGTTLAGLAVLEQQKFSDAVVSAVVAAARQSAELGQSAKK
jgi:pyrroline-5-carboxylate reductase